MVVFPNAKINIGLYVTQKRSDGYHDIETFFYPIPIHDILEFIPAEKTILEHSGLEIPGDPSKNLCIKAYTILKNRFSYLPPVHVYLHKLIPIGGGLGGGSSDGSFMLHALNTYFKLGLNEKDLCSIALELGSDCPFFISNKPSFALGRGEILESAKLHLDHLHLALVNPGIHVNTTEAFQGIKPVQPQKSIKDVIHFPVETWRQYIFNDFEKSVFPKFPTIGQLKQSLYDQGAIFASMSGTGSTCYGIFREKPDLRFPDHYKIVHCTLN